MNNDKQAHSQRKQLKQRRKFLYSFAALLATLPFVSVLVAKESKKTAYNKRPTKKVLDWGKTMDNVKKVELSEAEWKERLDPYAYQVLRKEGTERAGTSPLNDEKRAGDYLCAGCGLLLFTSDMKYDSGTGWPSFFRAVEDHIETKTDFKLVYPRTEYHCKRCGGHQGHVFKDGPQPTGKRYCNNGVALRFEAQT